MTLNPTQGMGQKPVDLIASGPYSTMDVMWSAIRKLTEFTRKDLMCAISKTHYVNDHTVKSYIQRLVKGHYLEVQPVVKDSGDRREHHYKLIHDVGIEAPRLANDGRPSQQGMGRVQLWRTMRIVGEFDCRDLALAASTQHKTIIISEAKDYIKHLYATGYLVQTKPCVCGPSPLPARYRLLPSKFTGPKPPQVQRVKQVFDPNLGKVMPKIIREVKP